MRRAVLGITCMLAAATSGACGGDDDTGSMDFDGGPDGATRSDGGMACAEPGLPDDERMHALGDWLGAEMSDRGIPGAVVAIVDGEDGFVLPLGETEEGGCPVTDDTRFLVAGLAHALTAIAVLDAAEEGVVALDAPVTDYGIDETLVASGEWGGASDVTLHHLLAQTAGLEPVAGLQTITECDENLAEWITPLELSLVAPPGELSRFNWVELLMAAHAFENASGTSIADAIDRRVFQPLGMDTAVMGAPDASDAPVAHGHLDLGSSIVPLPPTDYACDAMIAHNRAWLSARDAVPLLRMLAGSEASILTPEHLDAMADSGAPAYRYGTHDNGYGFITIDYDDSLGLGRVVTWHARVIGFHAGIRYYPDHGLGVFYAWNWLDASRSNSELWMAFQDEIARTFLDVPAACHCLTDESCKVDTRPSCIDPATVMRPESEWAVYAATYDATDGSDSSLVVTHEADALTIVPEGSSGAPSDLAPTGLDSFLVSGGELDGAKLRFYPETDSGRRWLVHGLDVYAERL